MRPVIKNDLSQKYNKGTIRIHWITLLLILALIPTGFIMADAKPGETKMLLLRVHVFVGAIVFILTLLRICFFFKHKRPAKLQTGSSFHNKMIIWIDNLFYVILLLLSISGIFTVILGEFRLAVTAADYTLLPTKLEVPPLLAHQVLAQILLILLIAHILGVINHYIKFKENTIKRILP